MNYQTAVFFSTLTKPAAGSEYKEFTVEGVSVWVRARGSRLDIQRALGIPPRKGETLLNSIELTGEDQP